MRKCDSVLTPSTLSHGNRVKLSRALLRAGAAKGPLETVVFGGTCVVGTKSYKRIFLKNWSKVLLNGGENSRSCLQTCYHKYSCCFRASKRFLKRSADFAAALVFSEPFDASKKSPRLRKSVLSRSIKVPPTCDVCLVSTKR